MQLPSFVIIIVIMSLFQRHRGLLQSLSLLREANAKRQNVMLDVANKTN